MKGRNAYLLAILLIGSVTSSQRTIASEPETSVSQKPKKAIFTVRAIMLGVLVCIFYLIYRNRVHESTDTSQINDKNAALLMDDEEALFVPANIGEEETNLKEEDKREIKTIEKKVKQWEKERCTYRTKIEEDKSKYFYANKVTRILIYNNGTQKWEEAKRKDLILKINYDKEVVFSFTGKNDVWNERTLLKIDKEKYTYQISPTISYTKNGRKRYVVEWEAKDKQTGFQRKWRAYFKKEKNVSVDYIIEFIKKFSYFTIE